VNFKLNKQVQVMNIHFCIST